MSQPINLTKLLFSTIEVTTFGLTVWIAIQNRTTQQQNEKRRSIANSSSQEHQERNLKVFSQLIKDEQEKENVAIADGESYPFNLPYSQDTIQYTFDNEGNILIKGATIHQLIRSLTEESGKGAQLCNSFLLTYRSFLTPKELLTLLIQRYHVPIKDASNIVHLNYQKHIKLRVWYVLKYWTENHFYDFEEDEELIKEYQQFITNVMQSDLGKVALQLSNIVEKQMTKQTKKDVIYLKNNSFPEPILPKDEWLQSNKQLGILDWDPLELARQMTLTEYTLYDEIQPKECLDQAWSKDGVSRAPHIVALIERFNQSSRWVTSEIMREEDMQTRADIITHFIQIANECRTLQNFNSMMGIVSGLMGSSVSRLKKTWQLVPSKIVETFEGEFSVLFDKNFKMLRDAVKQSEPPCLPYIGTYLADLTFIEDGNPNMIESNRLINFEKRIMISKVISELRVYQQRQYALLEVSIVRDFIESSLNGSRIELYDDKKCYELSLVREPRQRQ